jgi:hypothetical protein
MSVLATVVDPDGQTIVFESDAWDHIVDEHTEMADYRDAILLTVAEPDHRGNDPMPGRKRYWRQEVGPSRWLRVVVDFNVRPARIVTAFGNRKTPPEWKP